MLRKLIQDIERFPFLRNFVHVIVAHEKTNDAVWNDFAKIDEHASVVFDDGIFVTEIDLSTHLRQSSKTQ